MRKYLNILIVLMMLTLTACGSDVKVDDDDAYVEPYIPTEEETATEDEVEIYESHVIEEEESAKVPTTFEEMMDINDFNMDGLMMDKVVIEDFTYLLDNGMTYENHVSLQARLTRYLDYYVPTDDDKIWDVVIVEDDFADVPAVNLFYVYVEELDATIECKYHKDDEYKQIGIPYTFSCPSIEANKLEAGTYDKRDDPNNIPD